MAAFPGQRFAPEGRAPAGREELGVFGMSFHSRCGQVRAWPGSRLRQLGCRGQAAAGGGSMWGGCVPRPSQLRGRPACLLRKRLQHRLGEAVGGSAACVGSGLSQREHFPRPPGEQRRRAGAAPAVAPPSGPRLCLGVPGPLRTSPRPQVTDSGQAVISGFSFSPEETGLMSFRSHPFLKSSFHLQRSDLGATC